MYMTHLNDDEEVNEEKGKEAYKEGFERVHDQYTHQ